MAKQLFDILGISGRKEIVELSARTGITYEMLKYYNDNNFLPSTYDLNKLAEACGISKLEIMLSLGVLDREVLNAISLHSGKISAILEDSFPNKEVKNLKLEPTLVTEYGKLYSADCMDILNQTESNSVDVVFADPPFNLNKLYPSNINDNLIAEEYLTWSEKWIDECVRVLKPGGSFFLWNIPKWNTYFSEYLNHRLIFRHWIVSDIKFSLPIQGRLYPSHYSLLYYCKGDKPNYFKADRLPMEICPKCKTDLKDYGGYKDKMNPAGINLTDVWYDIPPVRHSKYKKRKGANELSLKLLDRVIEMASQPGDIILDPFGGSGSTYVAAELKKRKWIGMEIGPIHDIVDRFANINSEKALLAKYRQKYNNLFSQEDIVERKKRGLWTHETFHHDTHVHNNQLLIPIDI